jgi:hypothetical protein
VKEHIMSASTPSPTDLDEHAQEMHVGASPALARLVAGALVVGAACASAVLAWRPFPERNDISFTGFAPTADAAWIGALLDGVAVAVVGVSIGLAACCLVTSRGARWALVGVAATGLGGMLFLAGIFGYAALAWYAVQPAVGEPAGTALLDLVEKEPAHVLVPQVVGFLLFNIGTLLVAVALWRGRALHRPLIGVLVLLVLAQFAFPESMGPRRFIDAIQIGIMLVFGAVGLRLWRAAQNTAIGRRPE